MDSRVQIVCLAVFLLFLQDTFLGARREEFVKLLINILLFLINCI